MSSPKFLLYLTIFLGLFLQGCGGGGGTDAGSDFVFTGSTSRAAGARALTFNFVKAQEAALTVPANTTQIRFRFYSGANGTGTLVQEELRDFAPTITINPVDGATQSYVITAISNEGYPLLEVTAELDAEDEDIDFTGLNPVVVTADTLSLNPTSATIGVGETVQFQPFVLFSNGENLEPVAGDVTWDATLQASIDANGLATGDADGVSTVTATFETLTATADIIIGQGLLLTRLEVTPDGASVALNSDIQFSVAGFDQNDNDFSIDGLTVVWNATGDASIDMDTGLATGNSLVPNTLEGTATITATIDTLSDDTDLTIIGEPGNIVGITTAPDPLNIDLDAPLTGSLTTTGDFENGPDQVLTNADNGLLYSVTGNPGVASVDMLTGEVAAIAQGTTEVTATAGNNQMDTVTVNVDFGAAGNQAPTITVSSTPVDLGGTGAAPVVAFPAATVTDPTQASFIGGTLTIEALSPGNQDVVIALPANPDVGAIQTNNAATVSINLSVDATPAQVQALLQNVTVVANSIGTAELQISIDDGQGETGTASRDFVAATDSLTLAAGPHTYDTDTGLLDGVAVPSLNGTRLAFLSLDLQAGAILSVTGSNAFQLDTTGDILVDGTIDADGGAGGDAANDSPGGAGGVPGPGGFAGGDGADPAEFVASAGEGPGGGQGGRNELISAGPAASAGGGGAGHFAAGASGATLSASQPGILEGGAGGSAYASLPPFIGGSGGGGGSREDDLGPDDGGAGGGGGGGAVRITSLGSLTVSGTISCRGGNGGAGGGGTAGARGGGGSGGVIELLSSIAPSVTGTLDVSGGDGPAGDFAAAEGGDGSDGRMRVETF